VLSKILHPLYQPRYAVQTFLGVLLLAAVGLSVLAGSRRVRVLLALLVIAVSSPALAHLYRDRQKPPWREVAALVESRAADTDVVLLAPWFAEPAWSRYARRPLPTRRLRTDAESPDDWTILDGPESVGAASDRVFLVVRRPWTRLPAAGDPLVELGKSVLPEYTLEETAAFHLVLVGAFRRRDGR
jgi:hypothetical protein